MDGQELFQRTSDELAIDVFIGKFTCDIPFGGGDMESVDISLTNNSPKSRMHIPILRLNAGHQMDFEAHEQTPAGHAAMLVADWLNENTVPESARYSAELFLWQWPGVRLLEDGQWQLTTLEQRRAYLNEPLIDIHGKALDTDLNLNASTNHNLQVHPYGFCRKDGPCYLLDACLTCPWFATNTHFTSCLQERASDLQHRGVDAMTNHNRRLANACHHILVHLKTMLAALKHEPNSYTEGENHE